jgi:hypothetical protein
MARLHEDRCPVQREIFTQSLDGYVVLFVTIETLAHPFPNRIILTHKIIRTGLLAPRRPIRALASETSVTVGWGSNQSSTVRFKAREQMLRACCEPLRAMLRADCVQHPNISGPPPSSSHVATMLQLCCEHVATRVACNIQHQEPSSPPPPWHNTQHYMSATSKLNIRNIC